VTRVEPGDARYVARWQLDGVGGVVVAIDVLRAFTTAAYALDAGASRIWLAGTVEGALALGRSIPGSLVMGEEHGRRPDGFDLSNSPVAVAGSDLDGRDLVQRTSAGVQGILAARHADRLYAASLVVASATARAIDAAGLGAPTYVITGRFPDAAHRGEDDLLTAELIERIRTDRPDDAEATAAAIAATPDAARMSAAGEGHVHPDDLTLASAVDRFDFAMEVDRSDGRPFLRRVDAP